MKKISLLLLILALGCLTIRAEDTTGNAKAQADKAAAIRKAQSKTADSIAAAAKAQNNNKNKVVAATCKDADNSVLQWTGWLLIILIVGLFFGLTWKSDLLRAPIQDPVAFKQAAVATGKYTDGTDINKIPKPFSLSRSQLAVWTVVISCSYLYLELCRYASAPVLTIDKTLLGLMGISAATTAAGNIIDNNATADQQGAPKPSEGFFKDIMSDQNGINIHRFQNVVWTLIAVTLYISQIPDITCGSLPTLDATLVALTGISSATYLGLKINENVPPAIPPASKI
ncbi:hypothetical protein ACPPVU_12610 [Mucilaginibacter sp. McL0603]|uniref:hypothetical protein n=1 Tax=Mucilaginibacter sp. McL0603 TaxID=3415670 RepID=UPI003CF3CA8F